MRTRLFEKSVLSFSVVLGLIIVGISIVLYNNGPRVRLVTFDRDPAQTSLSRGSSVTVRFDRPLEDRDYSNQISFEPEVNVSTQTLPQAIIITLEENLDSSTSYELSIGPDVFDRTGKSMRSTHTHQFDTTAPRFVYLERNYEEFDGAEDMQDDTVWLSGVGQEPEALFSHPVITMFAANDQYVVIATRAEDEDLLTTINLETREQRQEELVLRGRINNLSLSPRGEVAIYSITPDFNTVSREYFNRFANRVDSISLTTGQTVSLTDENDFFIKVTSIDLENNGQVALVRDLEDTFYAISPYNDYDPVLVGSYIESLGFSADGTSVIFRNINGFTRYSVVDGSTGPVDYPVTGQLQSIREQEGVVFVSSGTFSGGAVRNFITRFDTTDTASLVWSGSEESLLSFNSSYDTGYLALQLNPDECRFDRLTPNAQCTNTLTAIVDSETGNELQRFDGFDLVWLP